MQKSLLQIAPAATYIPGGTATDISLSCLNDNNKTLPVKVSMVLLHITSEDPLEYEELQELGAGQIMGINLDSSIIIYASKIYNPCTEETVYVLDYINNIIPFIGCCVGDELPGNVGGGPPPVEPPEDEEPPVVPPGGGNMPAVNNKIEFIVQNNINNGTVIDCRLKFSSVQSVNIIWGDGLTSSLSGSNEYLFTHAFVLAGLYNVSMTFANENTLEELKLNSGNITGISGLEDFTVMEKLSLMDNLLTAMPTINSILTDINVNANLIEEFVSLPATLLVLECAANLFTEITFPLSLTYLDISANPNFTNPASLPADITLLNCAGCPLIDTLPALPAGLTELYCNDCALTALPALPNNIEVINAAGNELDVSAVDAIIVEIESQSIDDGILNLEDQTPAAVPTAATEIANLIGRGWEVTTD